MRKERTFTDYVLARKLSIYTFSELVSIFLLRVGRCSPHSTYQSLRFMIHLLLNGLCFIGQRVLQTIL